MNYNSSVTHDEYQVGDDNKGMMIILLVMIVTFYCTVSVQMGTTNPLDKFIFTISFLHRTHWIIFYS